MYRCLFTVRCDYAADYFRLLAAAGFARLPPPLFSDATLFFFHFRFRR